jgi:hypothetical protein
MRNRIIMGGLLALVLGIAAPQAANSYPLCSTCSCFSNCNMICSVDWPGGGMNDICENWLCRESPECDSFSDNTAALERFLFASNDGCVDRSTSSSETVRLEAVAEEPVSPAGDVILESTTL